MKKSKNVSKRLGKKKLNQAKTTTPLLPSPSKVKEQLLLLQDSATREGQRVVGGVTDQMFLLAIVTSNVADEAKSLVDLRASYVYETVLKSTISGDFVFYYCNCAFLPSHSCMIPNL